MVIVSLWLAEFSHNVFKNLFQPLLLFFYMGFLVPIFKIGFEFPYVVYQGLVIYLLVSIGWKGGEELAELAQHDPQRLVQALGFMVIGFITNFCIGCFAYFILRVASRLRRVDAATVAAYYGSDSAGTFVTCQGVLGSLQAGALAATVGFVALNPVSLGMKPDSKVDLATVGKALDIKDLDLQKLTAALNDKTTVDKWRSKGIDVDEVEKLQDAALKEQAQYKEAAYMPVMLAVMEIPGCLVGLYLVARLRRTGMDRLGNMPDEPGYDPKAKPDLPVGAAGHGHGGHGSEISVEGADNGSKKSPGIFSPAMLHEVFLNPGIYLLFGGIMIGFIGEWQGKSVVAKDDPVFLTLFHGLLCLYLLEMGMTASKRMKDLRAAGWMFIAFGIICPNIFAVVGMTVAHFYSQMLGVEFSVGTYALFAVLCAAASYIAVPAIQRIAIPEASPTLPLAASLGLTFSYNVTVGITVYIEFAKWLHHVWPIVGDETVTPADAHHAWHAVTSLAGFLC